ncbi:ABC transporter permease [Thermogemmatispora aurantia]|uniref:ABC transporter permease n=1 Tax=Thermogemmatispora aurantia TaxID=2045279 RepID=A0A5J4KAS6_9CHLR|nr:sugar ABC transporter permease [Thermogemmatispora aurantia]GER83827.1 ABC transporter permease [Thermogemmatispora aurantia]
MATIGAPLLQVKESSPRGPLERREERLAWLMLLPVILALLALGVYPVLSTLWFSFQQGGSFGLGTTSAGLANYLRLLHDEQFWSALRFSLLYSLVTVCGQMLCGTALALFANRRFRGRWLARAAILFPWAIPTATNSVIWAYMFNDQYGLINSLLEHLGLLNPAHPIVWLGSAQLATLLIYVLAIWKANSLVALLVLAGLQGIPEEVYEAARVDGASRWQILWRVTLPLLRPVLLVTLILRTIESLQAFDLISAFTNGGPGNATQNLGLYIYLQIQQFGDFGYGSTIAVVLTAITLLFIVLYMRTLLRTSTR